jgi:hypothetical protein
MDSVPVLRFDHRPAGLAVSLETLLRTRLLVQANSGGGKSHALRALLEQTHGKVLQLVLDPEGEFSTLREEFGFVLAGKDGDVPAHPKVARVLCRRLVETNASAIIDLYDLSLSDRREFVKLFLTELMALPRALWKPALIVLDEAHLFAPERGSGESQSTDAVIALCTQGRKRGFAAVLATQRISKLHKDAAAELLNKMIGRTGLDVDMKRAGDELGMDKEHRLQLRDLAPGDFFAYGPAMGGRVQAVRSAPVRTRHPDSNSLGASIPPASASVQALVAQIGDLPALATKELDERVALEQRVRELQAQLRAKATRGVQGISDAQVQAMLRDEYSRGIAVGNQMDDAQREAAQWWGRTSVITRLRKVLDEIEREPVKLPASAKPSEPSTPRERAKATEPNVTRTAPPTTQPAVRDASVSRPQQRMLDVMAQCEALGLDTPSYGHVAVWSNQSPKSSGFEKNLSTLCAAGYLERKGNRTVALTNAGHAQAAVVTEVPTLKDLHAAWMPFVSTPQQRMLTRLIAEYPAAIPFVELAHRTDQSPTSSGYEKNVSTLSSLGLLERQPGKLLRAGALLFPTGV